MRGKRMWHTLKLYTMMSATNRTRYYKEKNIFHSMGENCLIMDRKVPLYSQLISLGDNVNIASNVTFLTHDITHRMLNNIPELIEKRKKRFSEKVGCIEIGDNVFIGSGVSICYNVRIGCNVIIGASSVVTKDIPDNCVAAGVPARVISSFDEYLRKRERFDVDVQTQSEGISTETVSKMWDVFNKARENR